MKSRLESCAHAFGEEPSASPEQLFGALDAFLGQLSEARAECDAARRRRGEEERRTRHEQEVREYGPYLRGDLGRVKIWGWRI